jgi:RimJ/RimL family protein N-acetyltransferase
MTTTSSPKIRPASPGDLSAIVRAVGHAQFPEDLPLARLLREGKLAAWFEQLLGKSATGEAHVFAIDLPPEDYSIGQVALVWMPDITAWNLSYWLHPAYWSRGYGGRAVVGTLMQLYQAKRIDEVRAGVAITNRRSMQLLERAGFSRLEKKDSKLRSPYPEQMEVAEFIATGANWIARQSL